LVLLAMVVGFVSGVAISPDKAGRVFFDACSQVIPVLLLTLGVEGWLVRVPSPRRWGPLGQFLRLTPEIYLFALIVGAEAQCLDFLAVMGENDVRDPHYVYGTIIACLLGVMCLGVYGAWFRAITEGRLRRGEPDAGA
jgi:hypothetical protein